ncbi:hypothetical protein [Actinosynnema sp. NPDC023587]|uniref:hypothetical protein n=1 Tax=Actinosynnema sp. NPDC023587 TaxID=3154695 RepID=UPI0033FD3415
MTAPDPDMPGYSAAIGIADAYRDCRTVLASLETTWAALRDPEQPWPQTAMRLADQHVDLVAAAATVRRVLADATQAGAADQPGFAQALRDRANDLAELLATDPESRMTYYLAGNVQYYLHHPTTVWRVRQAAEELVVRRRKYMRDALAMVPAGRRS